MKRKVKVVEMVEVTIELAEQEEEDRFFEAAWFSGATPDVFIRKTTAKAVTR